LNLTHLTQTTIYKDAVLPDALLIKNPMVVINSASHLKGEGEETGELHRGYYNFTEAKTIVEVLSTLVQRVSDITALDVGICAPYKLQVAHIRKLIQERTWPKRFSSDQIMIATADAFQGSERKYMFVSIVRTSTHGLAFAVSLKRINVVLSRSNTASFVFINVNVLGGVIQQPKTVREDVREGLSTLRDLIDWQREQGNVYDLRSWPEMFKSQVSQTLVTQQYDTKKKEWWEHLYYVTLRRRV
jgi:superfamily I DNA and/or RNA helicase